MICRALVVLRMQSGLHSRRKTQDVNLNTEEGATVLACSKKQKEIHKTYTHEPCILDICRRARTRASSVGCAVRVSGSRVRQTFVYPPATTTHMSEKQNSWMWPRAKMGQTGTDGEKAPTGSDDTQRKICWENGRMWTCACA